MAEIVSRKSADLKGSDTNLSQATPNQAIQNHATQNQATQNHATQNNERYHDKLRTAVLEASRRLTVGTQDDTIPDILATIGGALDVDRVLVLENPPQAGPVSLCYAWQKPEVPQITREHFLEYPATSPELRRWLAPLYAGRHLSEIWRHAQGAVADLFRKLAIRSILIVPIVVSGKVWGSVGVDSCHNERDWAAVEIDLLNILANLIGTNIIRDRYIGLLQNSEQKFRTVAEAALDAMIVIDGAGTVQYWNPAATSILGYTAQEAAGRKIHEWIAPGSYREAAVAGLKQLQETGRGSLVGKMREFTATRKDGVEIPIELSIGSMRVDDKWCAIGVLRDISARKDAEQQIMRLATHDGLTGLPNRRVFVTEIEQAIARHRHRGEGFAVFYLDLDHFKDVNDTLGHPIGDLLLKEAATRLRATVRETDMVARFGGDEFAVLATDLANPTDAGILAEKIGSALTRPFLIDGAQIQSGATLGVATSTHEYRDAETLLAHADVALYRAKAEERGTFHFFTDQLHRDVRQRFHLLTELRRAIQQRELVLHYQPQVNMQTGAIVGLEALVRWLHPKAGMIPPSQFIPAAENSGLIIALGQFVLLEACRQTRQWIDEGMTVPAMAVNVSPTQFKWHSRLDEEVLDTLRKTRISASLLELELTETALMQASRDNSSLLQAMRDRGIRIAIDDFGTGYSCLDYLRRFPASRIKIAQTFVAEITHSAGSAAITRATISLGRELGLGVIAEGVETAEQVALLTQWGCHEAQGFRYAKPMPADKIPELLRLGKINNPDELPENSRCARSA